MRTFAFFVFILTVCIGHSQEIDDPKITDFEFLIGTWEITFDFYDPHKPERGVVFQETGTQECYYDLVLDGIPTYITCKGEVVSSKGRKRTFQESIRYSRFEGRFIRVGLFSNWPATSQETLSFFPADRKFTIKGRLPYPRNRTELYQDIYLFNESYDTYEREHIANYPEMPLTEFNLALKGTGKKIKE